MSGWRDDRIDIALAVQGLGVRDMALDDLRQALLGVLENVVDEIGRT